jgi:hypothetical protein
LEALNACPTERRFINRSWRWMSAYRMGLTGDAAQLTMGRTEAERSSQCFEDRNDAFGRCLTISGLHIFAIFYPKNLALSH